MANGFGRTLVPVIFALLVVCISGQVILSLDCGGTSSYTDPNGIPWSGDQTAISSGVPATVQTSVSVSKPLQTLRYFPTRKKNCYLFTDATQGTKYLIRAMFYYGNYDNLASPPIFDLHLNGNLWETVDTSGHRPVMSETVFINGASSFSVCVAQTRPGNIPFVSSIELRSLDAGMYKPMTQNYALLTTTRVAYGANSVVRFPSDAYDRMWFPTSQINGLNYLTSDLTTLVSGLVDNPPADALLRAVASSSPSLPLVLGFRFRRPSVQAYFNLYFSEVTQLDTTTQSRSFNFYVNGELSLDKPIVPPYQSGYEVYSYNATLPQNTNFSLVPTTTSTLPPIINAIEIFTISDPLTDGTDNNDVQVLSLLQTQYDQLQSWNGDPCLPTGFTWDWVNCSNSQPPRITALYLGGFALNGILPDLSSLSALEIIDLHNNSLSGEIPDFLGNLPNLRELNLADNKFSGSVPSSLTSNKNIKLDASGNPDLCSAGQSCPADSNSGNTAPTRTSSSAKKKKNKAGVVAGATIPSVLFFWAIVGAMFYVTQRRKANAMAAVNGGNMVGPGKTNPTPAHPQQSFLGAGQGAAHHQPGHDVHFSVELQQQQEESSDDVYSQQQYEQAYDVQQEDSITLNVTL